MAKHAMDFDKWWQRQNTVAINTDSPRDIAEKAWEAAKAQSGNYVADTVEAPHKVTFANGRTVQVGAGGSLQVGAGPYPP